MRRIVVLAEAAEDLESACGFYDGIEEGLGRHCVELLLSDIESLASYHGIHAVHCGCHRMLASRFPFGIYYLEHSDETRVLGILDLRRDPSWNRKELRRREK